MSGAREHPDRQKLEDAVQQIIPQLTREHQPEPFLICLGTQALAMRSLGASCTDTVHRTSVTRLAHYSTSEACEGIESSA